MRTLFPILLFTSYPISGSNSVCDELWCPLDYAADAASLGLDAGAWLIDNFKGLSDQPEPAPQTTIHYVDYTPANKDQRDNDTLTAMPPLGHNQCEAVAQHPDQDQNQES